MDRQPRAIRVKVAELPRGVKDVADLLNTPGGGEAFGAMIRNARDGPLWMIDHLEDVRGHDLTTLQGTVAACEDMVDTLLRQPPIARSAYVRALAQKLEVPEVEIRQTLNQTLAERAEHYQRHPEDRPTPPKSPPPPPDPDEGPPEIDVSDLLR
jgi:DNA primase